MIHVPQLDRAHDRHGYEAEDKHQTAEQPEKVHRFGSESTGEPKRGEIKIAVDKTVEAKFCLAVLPCLMVYHFLSNFVEAGKFGQIGYVAVHVAIDFDVFHHLAAVCLEAAVEVVQVADAAYFPGCSVEEFGWYGFRQWVVAFFLVARHEVVEADHAALAAEGRSEILDISQSAISHQLKTLREANLVKNRKDGKMVIYSLDDDHVKDIFEKALNHVLEIKEREEKK